MKRLLIFAILSICVALNAGVPSGFHEHGRPEEMRPLTRFFVDVDDIEFYQALTKEITARMPEITIVDKIDNSQAVMSVEIHDLPRNDREAVAIIWRVSDDGKSARLLAQIRYVRTHVWTPSLASGLTSKFADAYRGHP